MSVTSPKLSQQKSQKEHFVHNPIHVCQVLTLPCLAGLSLKFYVSKTRSIYHGLANKFSFVWKMALISCARQQHC